MELKINIYHCSIKQLLHNSLTQLPIYPSFSIWIAFRLLFAQIMLSNVGLTFLMNCDSYRTFRKLHFPYEPGKKENHLSVLWSDRLLCPSIKTFCWASVAYCCLVYSGMKKILRTQVNQDLNICRFQANTGLTLSAAVRIHPEPISFFFPKLAELLCCFIHACKVSTVHW